LKYWNGSLTVQGRGSERTFSDVAICELELRIFDFVEDAAL